MKQGIRRAAAWFFILCVFLGALPISSLAGAVASNVRNQYDSVLDRLDNTAPKDKASLREIQGMLDELSGFLQADSYRWIIEAMLVLYEDVPAAYTAHDDDILINLNLLMKDADFLADYSTRQNLPKLKSLVAYQSGRKAEAEGRLQDAVTFYLDSRLADYLDRLTKRVFPEMYQAAVSLEGAGQYAKAAELYRLLSDYGYSDSKSRYQNAAELAKPTPTSTLRPTPTPKPTPTPAPTPEPPYVFYDSGVERMVRDTLNRPIGDITAKDLEEISCLSMSPYYGFTISSDGTWWLEWTETWKTLQISDLRDLACLKSLVELDLAGPSIEDLTPLRELVELKNLNLFATSVKELTPLAGLTNLEDLDLDRNAIKDLTPLAGLKNLTYLDLSNNAVSDLTPLAGLTNLKRLDLFDNAITDLTPLAGLTSLEVLYLNGNAITDLMPLAGLTNLEYLGLERNEITDLTPLESVTNLRALYMNSNIIKDLTPLAGMPHLYQLWLGNNIIKDIAPLSGMTNLYELYLDHNNIASLGPLDKLTRLEYLKLNNNNISDLTPLRNLTGLEYLDIFDNPIKDYSPIDHLPPDNVYK